MRVKLAAVAGYARFVIVSSRREHLLPRSDVFSDGLACSATVFDADCADSFFIVGQREPRELLQFRWVNTVLANLKT